MGNSRQRRTERRVSEGMSRSRGILSQSSIEAYIGIIIGIIIWLVPVNALTRSGGLLIAVGLILHITWRSPWTIKWRGAEKVAITRLIVLIYVGIAISLIWHQRNMRNAEAQAAFARSNSPFSVNLESTFFEKWDNATWFIVNREKHELAPIPLAVFVNFTNLQDRPVMLEAYYVDVLINNGPPKRLQRIPVDNSGRSGEIMFGQCIANLDGLSLDNLITGKNIPPYEPLRGWLFFELLGTDFPPTGSTIYFRLHLWSITGSEFTGGFRVPNHGDESLLYAPIPCKERFNIQKLSRLRYSEFVRHL